MSFFKEIEGEGAVVVENGTYKQVSLYERDGYLFVKVGGGFVRLYADGATSKAGGKLKLDFMSFDGPLCRDPMGRLCSPTVKGAMSLESDKAQLLLGGTQ